MKIFNNLVINLATVKELMKFFWQQKLWWMIPFVLVLLAVGALLMFAQSSPAAPFIYAAF